MPANKKYFSNSPIKKIINLLVGFLGGFIISMESMIILGHIFNKEAVIYSYTVIGFIFWALLFIITYIINNLWIKITGAVLIIISLWGIIQIIH